jgi:hypothetical protein
MLSRCPLANKVCQLGVVRDNTFSALVDACYVSVRLARCNGVFLIADALDKFNNKKSYKWFVILELLVCLHWRWSFLEKISK